MKKLTVMLLVMTLVFGLAACGNASEKGSTVTETQAQSAEDTGAGNAELNKLYEKENAIIAKHQELWNTVFNNIDKNKAADAGEQNYGTFLETQLDHVRDQFSEADLKKLDKDETIFTTSSSSPDSASQMILSRVLYRKWGLICSCKSLSSAARRLISSTLISSTS